MWHLPCNARVLQREKSMEKVELLEVEEQGNGRLLFSVHLQEPKAKMELSVAIQDQGSAASNEATVLRSTISFAEELAASARFRLSAKPPTR